MAEEKTEQTQNPNKNLEKTQPEKKDDNFNYIVRVASADLDGNKQIVIALTKIKGVSCSLASAICHLAGIDISKKTGYLSESDIKKLSEAVENPAKLGAPVWLFNRRNDPETGDDKHLLGGDLQFAKENDIKTMQKIKCYKGMRHAVGLPVRGQRTKSNFRRSKSKSKGKATIGVKKKAGKK